MRRVRRTDGTKGASPTSSPELGFLSGSLRSEMTAPEGSNI